MRLPASWACKFARQPEPGSGEMSQQTDDAVVLRPAAPADADAIHAMIKALAEEVGAAENVSSTPADIGRFGFSDPPAFHAIIAERSGKAVGLCLYFFSFSTWRGTPGIYIQDIYVASSERGRGLARRLLVESARSAAGQGAKFLRLSVDSENVAARKFYEKLGIRHSAKECIYMAFGEDFETLKTLG
jgi:ribosomal protein S18 acetylase RimI-like enzyme